MTGTLLRDAQLVITNISHSFIWLLILTVIFVPLERLFALHRARIFRRETATDLGYYFLNSIIPALVLSGPFAIAAWLGHAVFPSTLQQAVTSMPIWARACLAMLVAELGYYWGHRLSHEIPFLWRFHAIHHSAGHVDFLVSSRAHPVDLVWSRLVLLAPLYILGLVSPLHSTDGIIPLVVLLTGSIWGFFIHANVNWRLGPLEWLLATPAFHHWHPTLPEPRDRNYSTMFPWMDRVFGTHYLPKHAWPAGYGIEEPMPQTMTGQLAQPLREIAGGVSPA